MQVITRQFPSITQKSSFMEKSKLATLATWIKRWSVQSFETWAEWKHVAKAISALWIIVTLLSNYYAANWNIYMNKIECSVTKIISILYLFILSKTCTVVKEDIYPPTTVSAPIERHSWIKRQLEENATFWPKSGNF